MISPKTVSVFRVCVVWTVIGVYIQLSATKSAAKAGFINCWVYPLESHQILAAAGFLQLDGKCHSASGDTVL